jgi:hypothetical protein
VAHSALLVVDFGGAVETGPQRNTVLSRGRTMRNHAEPTTSGSPPWNVIWKRSCGPSSLWWPPVSVIVSWAPFGPPSAAPPRVALDRNRRCQATTASSVSRDIVLPDPRGPKQ